MRALIESMADEAWRDHEDWNKENADGVTLRAWYVEVEMEVYEAVGVTASDLPDTEMWWDEWDGCTEAKDYAVQLLAANGLEVL